MQVRLHRVGGGVFVGRRPPPTLSGPLLEIENSFTVFLGAFTHTHTHTRSAKLARCGAARFIECFWPFWLTVGLDRHPVITLVKMNWTQVSSHRWSGPGFGNAKRCKTDSTCEICENNMNHLQGAFSFGKVCFATHNIRVHIIEAGSQQVVNLIDWLCVGRKASCLKFRHENSMLL